MPSCHAEPRTDCVWSSILRKLLVRNIQVLHDVLFVKASYLGIYKRCEGLNAYRVSAILGKKGK